VWQDVRRTPATIVEPVSEPNLFTKQRSGNEDIMTGKKRLFDCHQMMASK
jgi:hypothetical protein